MRNIKAGTKKNANFRTRFWCLAAVEITLSRGLFRLINRLTERMREACGQFAATAVSFALASIRSAPLRNQLMGTLGLLTTRFIE